MKQLCVFFLASLITFSGFAQKNWGRISIAVGSADPFPKYGVAFSQTKVGVDAALSYEYEFKKSDFGVLIEVRTRSHMLDPDPVSYDDPDVSYSEKKGLVKFRAALAGLSYRKQFNSRWSIGGRLLAGATKFSFGSTEQKYVSTPPPMPGYDGILEYRVDGGSGEGFTAVAALGPRFKITRHFDIFINAEYWYTHLNAIETTEYLEGYRDHIDYPFFGKNPSSFDLVAGLGFRF